MRKSIRLGRAQIGKASGVDITVKSSRGWAKAFAPTWELVMGHKQGVISDAEYVARYTEILQSIPDPRQDKSADNPWRQLFQAAVQGQTTILCYCRDGKFCHTHLVMEYACTHWPEVFCL